MKHALKSVGVLLALTVSLLTSLAAQNASDVGPAIEPEAVEALKKMGVYLRSLKAFQVNSKVTSETVLTDGQKVTLGRNTTLLADPPNRFRARIEGQKGTTFYLFDGKTFTLFSRDDGYYATFNAPSTVRQLVDILDEKYGIEIPLVDLFLWGAKDVEAPKITGAIKLGPAEIEGVTCEHYAFRQEGLDWQVWLQRGEFPLPRKLVLTTTTDDARPQHISVLDWNLAPSYNEAAFIFTPPPNTHKIVFAGQSAAK